MGQSAAQTVREIEEVRGRLERNVRELQDRLPRPAVWVKRLAGVAVGGGVAGSLFWFAVRRARKKKHEPESSRTVVQVVSPSAADDESRDGATTWIAAAAGVLVALRLLELRQLKKQNKLLVSRP